VSATVLFPPRAVDTATVRYTGAPHRRRRVTIDHRPLAAVTPEMLLDWFTHLDGTILYGGVFTDRYLAWHPVDHIRWERLDSGDPIDPVYRHSLPAYRALRLSGDVVAVRS
jgi:hypothetical protein